MSLLRLQVKSNDQAAAFDTAPSFYKDICGWLNIPSSGGVVILLVLFLEGAHKLVMRCRFKQVGRRWQPIMRTLSWRFQRRKWGLGPTVE